LLAHCLVDKRPKQGGDKREATKQEEVMAEQNSDKAETRAMWIMVAVVVVLILAGTGWNMWTHPDWIHGH